MKERAGLMVVMLFLVAALVWVVSRTSGPPGALPGAWQLEPTARVESSPDVLALGQAVYAKQCTACHGPQGRGDGPAAYLLYPKPRNFVDAWYRIVSTWEGTPTDEDLFRTISRGMPGSAMPSWAHLPEATRWALVHYVKLFAKEPLQIASPTLDNPRAGVVQVPPEPASSPELEARAATLFAASCAPCHGAEAKGDGVKEQRDSDGFPIRPRDLTLGVYKGSPEPEHVYRRIVAGMPGTPMPATTYLHGDDAWSLVQLLRSLSSEEQRRRTEMRRFEIVAARVSSLPSHPDDGLWSSAARVNLHLMPLWWRAQRPEELTVQALHDGKDLALLLSWMDETHDHTAMRPQDFRDAVAVQFALTGDPPFFAMGAAGEHVNIWMWKSERQADLEPAFQDLEKVYPHIGIDAYPNLQLSPLEQPLRHALTLRSDPTFVTGWGAGNIVSDPTRKSSVEDLSAQGFGTLTARPKLDQTVEATGSYSTGTYRVAFRRRLEGRGRGAVSLTRGRSFPIAFAVWNGSAGDRDGKKSVTIWQELKLE